MRAEAEREDRKLLLEAELVAGGRNRAQLNRQPLRRARDLLGALRVTVFSPDDLTIVKGGPGERRRFLDEALVAVHPRNDALIGDVDRILRQRNALLKQAGGRMTDRDRADARCVRRQARDGRRGLGSSPSGTGERSRPDPVRCLRPRGPSAPFGSTPCMTRHGCRAGLLAVLHEGRSQDVKRGVTLAGPHRDDLDLVLGGLSSRAYASQGEQRSLALALRLAAHDVVTRRTGTSPVLLLDDVFSELDPDRSDALMANLPAGQTVLSTASGLPSGARPGAGAHGSRRHGRGGMRHRSTRRPAKIDPCPGSRCPIRDDMGPEPRPMPEILDQVLAGLGAPSADAVVTVSERWSDLIGAEVAAHVTPVSIEHGRLTMVADSPAWASHVRWARPTCSPGWLC